MKDAADPEGGIVTQETPSIFLATPCYGGQAHAIYMQSLLALRPACADRGVGLAIELGGGEALIGRGRAAMMAKFLASPAGRLLFIDADIGFPAEAVFRLLRSPFDVVAGAYPAKVQDPGRPLRYEFEPLDADLPQSAEGFRQVASAGTGFMMISRRAAQRMTDGYPALHARLGDTHQVGVAAAAMVFDSMTDPATGRYLADHQAFCHRWRALGGEVWLDPESRLEHVGGVVHAGGAEI